MDREGVSRFPGRRGPDPQLRRRQARGREARRPPRLEARPGDQGEPGLAADARPPARPRGGQDAGHGGAAAARPAPVPAARPAQADAEAGARGGDDQGRAAARAGRRRSRSCPRSTSSSAARSRSTSSGARVGKGGGFSDLEYGLLIEARQDRRAHRRRDHRAPDPDPAREPDGDRPRPAGRPDRDAARGDRGRARSTSARAGSSGTTCSRRRSARSRSSSGWATRERAGRERSSATSRSLPGVDPVGRRSARARPDPGRRARPLRQPDEPEWLRIDWREHLRDGRASTATRRQLRRARAATRAGSGRWRSSSSTGSRAAGRTGSRSSPTSPAPPGDRPRPARLRRQPDAAVGDLDPEPTGGCCATSATRSRSATAAWSATRWAASSPPRRRSREPDRFEKLVLVSAAGVSSARLRREPAEVGGADAAPPAPARVQPADADRSGARALARLAFRNIFRHPRELRPRAALGVLPGRHRAATGFADALSALAGYDFLDRLDDVEVPTLIVWGRNDRVVPPADALEYGRLLRNSETVIFDDCGHVPQAERPVRFNRLLEEFLRAAERLSR